MADDDLLKAILGIAAGIAIGAGVVALLKMISEEDEDDLIEGGDEDDW
jgi:hypothetical protein